MQIAVVTETYPPEINGVALTVAKAVAFLRERQHGVDVVRPAQAGEARGDTAGDGGDFRADTVAGKEQKRLRHA